MGKYTFKKHIKKFRNRKNLGIIESMQFKDNIKDVKAFWEGKDLFMEGLIEMDYSLRIIGKGGDTYNVIYFQDAETSFYTPNNFYIQSNDFCLRMVVKSASKKWLSCWSMPYHLLDSLFKIIKK